MAHRRSGQAFSGLMRTMQAHVDLADYLIHVWCYNRCHEDVDVITREVEPGGMQPWIRKKLPLPRHDLKVVNLP